MADGYLPACHATLLRWQAASRTGGTYLTSRERQWLRLEIDTYRKNLEAWEQQAWRHYDGANRHKTPPIALRRADFEQSIRHAEAERIRLLTTLTRIDALSERLITRADVYGEAAGHTLLEQLVVRWLEHTENNAAARSPAHTMISQSSAAYA